MVVKSHDQRHHASTRQNGEIDVTDLLMSRVQNRMNANGFAAQPQHAPQSTQANVGYIQKGAMLYRRLESGGFGGTHDLVVCIGRYEEDGRREFKIGQPSACRIVEGTNTIDLSKPNSTKSANLVPVSAMFVGSYYVHESAIRRSYAGQRKEGILLKG